jgi:HNH endonuclease
MKASIRAFVRTRAGRRCEYCHLAEEDVPLFPFHAEHILPKKHGGTDDPGMLAWSCHHCNLAKSSNLSGRDSISGRVVVLFNPRRQRWQRHFAWQGPRLVGLTPSGRATVGVLNINAKYRIELRQLLIQIGRFPAE